MKTIAAILLLISVLAGAEQPGTAPSATVPVFFESAGTFVAEQTSVAADAPLETKVRNVVERLIAGPKEPGHTATMPATAALRRVFIGGENGCYLDFDKNLLKDHPGGIGAEMLSVGALCKTIFNSFPFESVTILVEGKEVKTLAGHVDIERPIYRAACEALFNKRAE